MREASYALAGTLLLLAVKLWALEAARPELPGPTVRGVTDGAAAVIGIEAGASE